MRVQRSRGMMRHELPLDLERVVALGDAEPIGDAQDVGVDGDALAMS